MRQIDLTAQKPWSRQLVVAARTDAPSALKPSTQTLPRKVWQIQPADQAAQLNLKGRGATALVPSRYDQDQRQTSTEWQQSQWVEDNTFNDSQQKPTQVRFENTGRAINRNASPDLPFDLSVNPYRGCEHGCVYCYARPTHSYLGLSPSLDFETKLIAKRNIAEQLQHELSSRSHQPQPINLGAATDCYQPIERDLRLTRSVLEVMARMRHPFTLFTKNSLIERDIDLLAPLSKSGLAHITLTITTLDHAVSRILEPRAASPTRRLQTIEKLRKAGVSVGVSVAPIIPFVTDDQIEKILIAAHNAGATVAHYTVVRLPWEVDPLFTQWLEHHFPDRAQRVMQRIRDLRGGKNYDSNFATRMKGQGIWAELIRQRFDGTARSLGLNRQPPELDVSQFVRSARANELKQHVQHEQQASKTAVPSHPQLNLF